MAGLSNIFGGTSGDDSQSSNDQNLDTSTVTDASNVIGLDVDSSQSNYNEDEDGNVSSSQNDNSLNFDSDTDSLLGNVTDLTSQSDESNS